MGVKIGNLDISAFKVGSADCAIYLGDVKLYPSEQPSFQGKWLATYTAGTTSSAECGTSSVINANEIPLTDLQSVLIGDCVTSIGNYAFLFCTSLTSIDIPSSVTSIGEDAFYDCTSLSSCTIGNGVTTIGSNAFRGCTSLTSIDIPSSVTSIGEDAFYDCSNLTSVTVNATTPPTLSGGVFGSTNNCPIYVPAESVNAYKSASGWSNYASRIQAIPSPYQWVTFTNGDTISSDLNIYGISGVSQNLYDTFGYGEHFQFAQSRNKIDWFMVNNNSQTCYYGDSVLTTEVISAICSELGCDDYYNQGATVSGTIQLLIYV